MKFALLGTKRLVSFFAVSACAILVACSADDDDFMFTKTAEEKAESNSEIQMVRSYERLPECTGEREGVEFFVKDEREFYTCDGEDWVSDSEEPASSSSRKSSSSSFDDLYEDNLSSLADSIQRVIDSLTALYTSSSSVLIMPMYSSSSSLPTFLFSSSSAMVSSSSMVVPSSSSYVLPPPTAAHNNVFFWDGSDGMPYIETGLDNGTETSGYWYTFEDTFDGGLSYIDWPAPLGNEYDDKAMDPVMEVCGGICGTAHLEAGTLEYKPFVGVAFNIAGTTSYSSDYLADADLADASAWGGICITYTSDLPATLELGFGAYKDVLLEYDNPFVTLAKASVPDERCFEWSAFKQAGWGRGDKITGEEAGAELATIKFKIQAADGSVGQFNIMRIGSYN